MKVVRTESKIILNLNIRCPTSPGTENQYLVISKNGRLFGINLCLKKIKRTEANINLDLLIFFHKYFAPWPLSSELREKYVHTLHFTHYLQLQYKCISKYLLWLKSICENENINF